MIVAVTLNPAVDQTMWLDHLATGEVNRAPRVQLDPAGKGVNAARMAHRLGWPTLALGFLAGNTGQVVEDALDSEHVQHHFIRIPGQTRVDVTVVEANGHATSLFGPGPPAPPGALAQLDEVLGCWLQSGHILILGGSLLPNVPDDTYARYIQLARARGSRTILDTGGRALHQGVLALPDVIKPNELEAAALLGRPLPDEDAVLGGALELHQRGIATVVISMGSRGALCVSSAGAWKVLPPTVARISTVGSGDSMVAGLAVAMARGEPLIEGLRLGAAAGAATAMTPGTMLGTAEEVARLLPLVEILPLELEPRAALKPVR